MNEIIAVVIIGMIFIACILIMGAVIDKFADHLMRRGLP